jgi:hypothetical protein
MMRDLSPKATTALVTVVAIALSLAITTLVPIPVHGPPGRELPAEIVLLIRSELFFTTLNLLLLLALTGIYTKLYRDLPNKYTVSLLVLSLALVLYAFTSNPVVHFLFGLRPRPNIGAFVFIPDLFVGLAIVVLLYQSQT